jgi:hypothetical protein
MKTRLLSRQCPTCVFKPGNLMKLRTGRLHDLIAQACAAESYIVCHSTLVRHEASHDRTEVEDLRHLAVAAVG